MKTCLPCHPTKYFAFAAALMASPGCSSGDMSPVNSANSQGDAAGAALSFAANVYPIIAAKCIGCHSAAAGSALDLSVSAGDALGKLVGKPPPATAGLPCASSTEKLVVAGNSAMSILYSKVSSDTPVCGARMPYGRTPLSTIDQTTIKNWIDEGAQP